MKRIVFAVVVFVLTGVVGAKAQEFVVCADVVSSYVWRGQYLGGAAIQPGVGFSAAGFSIGAWGSVDIVNSFSAKEVDLTVGYEIAGLSVGITDYYIVNQGGSTDEAGEVVPRPGYFNYSKAGGTGHTFEANIVYGLPFESFPLTLAWNTNFAGTDGVNGDGETAYSSYFEVLYPFTVKDVSLGAVVGLVPWGTSFYGTERLNVTKVSLRASKKLKIGDFALPVFTQLIVNPCAEDAFLVFGVSF
jgi:hypothetical protein